MTDWASKIRQGDARALARAATAVENRDPRIAATLDDLAPFSGHARVIGITGPPGAGKSTLVGALALALRKRGQTVAIVAVDPSSHISGGAILGDRIRMQQHHADPGIFIRSVATRGASGGLARATAGLVRLMDCAGKDAVLIETVGVGQDEIDIASLAAVTLVVLVPGMGDDVQAIKAGIMEVADVFVINKADLAGADRLEHEIEAERPGVPVVKTIASAGQGIEELLDAVGQVSATPMPPLTDPLSAKSGESAAGGVGPVLPPANHTLHHVSIDHLGIAVPALEPAIAFYESLGLRVTQRETVPQEQVRVALLPAGDSRLELLEPCAAGSAVGKFLAKRGPGLHHVALRVPDLDAAITRLAAGGARLLGEPRTGAGGHRYVFVHPASSGGVLLELIQENPS